MSSYHPNPNLDLVLARTVPLEPAQIWAAWTEPALLMQWFTPAPWKTVAAELDLRPGGRFVTTAESPDGDRYPNAGCYLHLEPSRQIIFTSVMGADFRPAAPANGAADLAFTARIEWEAAKEGGSDYQATCMHATEESCRQHADMGFNEGWGAALDQLVALMT